MLRDGAGATPRQELGLGLQEGFAMKDKRISGIAGSVVARLAGKSHVMALALIISVMSLAVGTQSAHAQTTGDTWKSVAIIGGSSAAGAYIGHKIGGRTGTVIGAAGGAAVGYAIDKRRRDNQYNNQYGYAPGPGPYDPNAGYYPNDGGYYGNGGGYPAGPYYGSDYPASQYRSNSGNNYRRGFRR